MRAIFLVAGEVEDLEFFVPYYRLIEEGVECDVAAPHPGRVTGKHGYEIEANLSFAEGDAAAYDAVVLPGGRAPETVRLDPHAIDLVRAIFNAGKPVAAICHGPQILSSAGLLAGRRATSWPGIFDDIRNAGAAVVDAEVVVDGNLITSRRPSDLPAFCRELAAALERRRSGGSHNS